MHKAKLVGQLASALHHPPCLCEVIERYPGAHSAHFLWWKSLTLHFAAAFILTVCAFLLGGRACAHLCAALERLVGLGVSVPVIVHDATFAFLLKQTVCPLGRYHCQLLARQRIEKGC